MSFIAIEGPDGVGKTDASKAVAAHLGYEYVKTPSSLYLPIRRNVEEAWKNPLARFFYYLGGVFQSSEEIRDMLASGKSVVADRYTDSLCIFHEAMIGPYVPETIAAIPFAKPDLTLVLTAPIDVLKERRMRRGEKTSDRRLEDDDAYMARVLAMYQSLDQPDYVHIDARKPQQRVIDDCIDAAIKYSR